MVKPQQPELHRSGYGPSDPSSTKTQVEVGGAGAGTTDAPGPVPADNVPGHHPEHEQDKPVRRFRARARAVAAEAAAQAEADREITEHQVRANGMTFRVLEAGPSNGDPVVLLHGFPQTADSWDPVMDILVDAGYRVVAPDQRGYSSGARPSGAKAYRVPELVSDVEAIADSLGLGRFHLVGHDWGGVVAWAMGATRPEQLRTLTVVSTPHPKAYLGAMARSLQAFRSLYVGFFSIPVLSETVLKAGNGALLRRSLRSSGLPADQADRYTDAMLEPGALTAALNWYRAAPRALNGIGPVRVPTLYVWSTGDVALGRAAAESTKAHVTGPYRFEVLEGVSHWIPETAADRLATLIMAQLG